jgi:outer membrane protein assembly factor BamE (lipoprotein component of BamABCDE complex)
MNNNILFALVTCILVLASGCAYKDISVGTAISQEEASSNLVRGKSTKRDVFLNFGEPTKTADDEKVFFYSWTDGTKIAILGIGGGSSEGSSLVVIFDEEGIVEDYRITRGAAQGQQVD